MDWILLSLFAATIIIIGSVQTSRCSVKTSASGLHYALQVRPITFPVEPQSQRVLINSSAIFSCNASLEPIPHYPIPELSWRHNGRQLSLILGSGTNWEVVNYSHSFTELRINGVHAEDAGYYECVASDGNGTNYVTVSRRAWLEVIEVSMVPELQCVSLNFSSPHLLHCTTGASLPPEHAHWVHNGRLLLHGEQSTAILSDGSLLILRATATTAGSYQCVGWYGSEHLNSTEFNISVTEEQYNQQPLVTVDPLEVAVTVGQPLNITCYVAGTTANNSYELRWLMNGEEIAGENSSVLQLHEVSDAHSGTSTCEIVTADGGIYSANSSITVAVPPTITDPEPAFRSNFDVGFLRSWPDQLVWDVKIFTSDPNHPLVIPCEARGHPSPQIYWYRNGENITQYSDTSGRLSFEGVGGQIDSILGVYQCFSENNAGVEYITTRILKDGFSNPPRNLTCTVTKQDDSNDPRVLLKWSPPVLNTGRVIRYFVSSQIHGGIGVIQRHQLVSSTSITFDFTSEGQIDSVVHVDGVIGQPDNAPAICIARTSTRLRGCIYPLNVTCPSEPNTPVIVEWENPAALYYGFLLNTVTLNGICIFGNDTMRNSISERGFDDHYHDIDDVSLASNGIQWENGGVCIFWGTYDYFVPFLGETFAIPPERCQVPVDGDEYLHSSGPVRLGLSCDNVMVTLSWYTCNSEYNGVQNITLQGRCLNHRPDGTWKYQIATEELEGIVTLEGMPADGICSLFGFYNDYDGDTVQISPVQCIMGQEVDVHYQLIDPAVLVPCSLSPSSTSVDTASTPVSVYTLLAAYHSQFGTTPLQTTIPPPTSLPTSQATTDSPDTQGNNSNFTATMASAIIFAIICIIVLASLIVTTVIVIRKQVLKRRRCRRVALEQEKKTVPTIDEISLQVVSNNIIELRQLVTGRFCKIVLAQTVGLSAKDLKLSDSDNDRSKSLLVVLKKLKPNATQEQREAFEKESQFMARLKNKNVIHFMGVCTSDTPFILMEYMENGSLNRYLQLFTSVVTTPNKTHLQEGQISISTLLYMSTQVASAMKYLVSCNCIHRDLATWNCLVGREFVVKLADFGLSRNLYQSHYCHLHGHAVLPIRWMATECFHGKFSQKSDVWAFGITMWEIYTLAKNKPYFEMSNDEVIRDAKSGEARSLLTRPCVCPPDVYEVMLKCWSHDPLKRATFEEIHALLLAARECNMAIKNLYNS